MRTWRIIDVVAVSLLGGLVVVGCDEGGGADIGAADAVASADADRPGDPTPWIYEPDAPTSAPLTAEDRAAAIVAAVDAAAELEPQVIMDLHQGLFAAPPLGDGDLLGCPAFLTYDYGAATAYYWQGECTGDDGTRYSGYGYVANYDAYPADGAVLTGFELTLAGRIEAADGTWLEGTGTVTGYGGTYGPDVDAVVAGLDGTFRAGGPRAPDSVWLDGTRRPALAVSAWTYRPTGGRNLTVAGGIGGLAAFPDGVDAVSLDGLTLREVLAGATCGTEPGGAAAIRGPDGAWYDVLFDGPVDDAPETPPDLCDGCGETWYRGVAVEPTCVALTLPPLAP